MRRAWIGLAVLALPTLLLSLDLSVLYLALPRLSADLGADGVQQLWITDTYGFVVAGLLVTMGTLGDRIGRRRLLMIGAAVFGLASVAAAFSTSVATLIAARALMGVAGATLMPSTLTLIAALFEDPGRRATAIATWMSCVMGGSVLGPLVGGLLLEYFWWGSVFLLAAPVMLVLLVTAPVLLPEARSVEGGRLDPLSVALSLATILPAVYGIKRLAESGWAPIPLLFLAAGPVFGVLFVRRQLRLPRPLLDVRLFRDRTFGSALTMTVFGGVFLAGSTLLVSQFLQLVHGLSPLRAGLWLVPAVIAMIAGPQLGPVLARRVRPGRVMAAGMAVSALGYLLLTKVAATGRPTALVVGWIVALGGCGLPAGLGVGLIIGSVRPERAGSASAIQQTGTELGLALGIAVVGSLATAVYRAKMAGSGQAARGSVTAAEQVPGLLGAARAAYTAALNTAAGATAVVFLALAVLSAVALRHVPPLRS